MSRYDGLIIPRSYNEYINKTDPVAMSQALQLNGVLSGTVAAGDNKAVKSSAVNAALANYPKTEKVLTVSIDNTIDRTFKILTWNTTNKGGAIIRVDFSSRFGNSGFGSGSIIVTFNTTLTSTIWLLGEMGSGHAYFRLTRDTSNSNIEYLELVTLGGSNRQLKGNIKITPLAIYESSITYHEFELQTNDVVLIDSTQNKIIKNTDLKNYTKVFNIGSPAGATRYYKLTSSYSKVSNVMYANRYGGSFLVLGNESALSKIVKLNGGGNYGVSKAKLATDANNKGIFIFAINGYNLADLIVLQSPVTAEYTFEQSTETAYNNVTTGNGYTNITEYPTMNTPYYQIVTP